MGIVVCVGVGAGVGVEVEVGMGVGEEVGHGVLGIGVGVTHTGLRVKDVAFRLVDPVIVGKFGINEITIILIKMHTHENINATFRLDICVAFINSPFSF
jgi:hypothetical protein